MKLKYSLFALLISSLLVTSCGDQEHNHDNDSDAHHSDEDQPKDGDLGKAFEEMRENYDRVHTGLEEAMAAMTSAKDAASTETQPAIQTKIETLEKLDERLHIWNAAYENTAPEHDHGDHEGHDHAHHDHGAKLNLDEFPQDQRDLIVNGMRDDLADIEKRMKAVVAGN